MRTVPAVSAFAVSVAIAVTVIATAAAIRPVPASFDDVVADVRRETFVDRYGERLDSDLDNPWNVDDRIPLHELPALLPEAFVAAEDARFFDHAGVDWRARAAAVLANVRAGRVVRGASTISEQVVRLLHPRPRTLWSRFIEGFEAGALERKHDKVAILEFYLNQVPYAGRRRGVAQAAHYYFDRDPDTLSEKELLALAVIVRAPRWFDPVTRRAALERAVNRLAVRLAERGSLRLDPATLARQPFAPRRPERAVDAQHFVRYAARHVQPSARPGHAIQTSLDRSLQRTVQGLVDARLAALSGRRVHNAAVLAVDHTTNEILAWVVGNADRADKPFNAIDAVTVRRQPGSALKPLLYTEALARGWSAATLLDDAPLEQRVGAGLHAYRNYSRRYYGRVSVREALGNSLNIPAVRAIQFVGPAVFLDRLHELGIDGLHAHPDRYGDGLALGNGEVSLLELTGAYAALARMGEYRTLTAFTRPAGDVVSRQVFPADVASLIADILSDPHAREKEFGRFSILNFAAPTAVKTGTSSDYRDAWALGYDDRYTVGVWMGNLDYTPMDEVTGATGPALVLRATFRELNRHRERRPLYRSPNLVLASVCRNTGRPPVLPCETRDEWFVRGADTVAADTANAPLRLLKPIEGLRLAMDPRIPDSHEYFEFELGGAGDGGEIRWYVNDEHVATTDSTRFAWKIARGAFTVHAEIRRTRSGKRVSTPSVHYMVN